MARFSPARFPPGFFDLPADAGKALPLDIIAAWTRGPQTPGAAHTLLAPHTLRGTVVTSDAAGLTRLTRERSLVEILALISRPKELVHAFGRAAGGRPLGVWAADNTAMFYAREFAPADIAGMLLALVDQVVKECEVGIGLACHLGEFFELGDGIYGADADLVETLAEDYTGAGEVVVTEAVHHELTEQLGFRLAPRAGVPARFGPVHRVIAGPRAALEPSDFRYPLPFTDEFYGGLDEFHRTRRTSVVPRPAYRNGAVLVLEREAEDREIPEVAALNDLALAAGVKRVADELLRREGGLEVKTGGRGSIYLFDDVTTAIGFGRGLRARLDEQGVRLALGLDLGQVLLFELDQGLRDIAGSPVNVASKLAQGGGLGALTLSVAAAEHAGIPIEAAEDLAVSGVRVRALRL